jgi:hypothetical protein
MSERPSTAIVKALAEFAGLRIEDTLNLLADPMAAAKLKRIVKHRRSLRQSYQRWGDWHAQGNQKISVR